MKAIVLDLETSVQTVGGELDGSPYNPDNFCVSAHWREVDELGQIGEAQRLIWNHNEKNGSDPRQPLQDALNECGELVAHNAKFDVQWLLEMEFDLPERVWCTMIGEYILARGQWVGLSLKDTAERRRVTRKRSDVTEDYFKKGIGFDQMPLDVMVEYADADVLSAAEIYLAQLDDLEADNNKGLRPVFDLMFEMLWFLVEIEQNGIKIDLNALSEVEDQFRAEKQEIECRLNEIVGKVMGDTPVNLNSGPDMSAVVYSRRVTDRELHKRMFNIGMNGAGKPLPTPRMNKSEFAGAVRATTAVVEKTVVQCCPDCDGSGKQRKFRKDGQPYKRQPKCKVCDGDGVIYAKTGEKAGLRLVPEGPADANVHGFKVDKNTIKRLVAQAEDKKRPLAVEFLKKISRLNAVNTYLSSFVHGIQAWTREDGLLHPNFNQTVARTGRLSSSKPNFQNQPKGGKFPVRKAVTSRFDGGQIIEADFSGLEFRVAGELSRDSQIIEDIVDGKDIHRQTASIINQCNVSEVTKEMRQAAKQFSFAPLYGGQGAAEPEHVQQYFKEFFTIYKGMARKHREWMDGVLKDGIVRIPSGREYYFPDAKRLRSGRITNATAVVNYPVQGFATGDLVPLACIRAQRIFKREGLRSKLILTVHDSIVVDVHHDELSVVCDALSEAMDLHDEIFERFGYEFSIPLAIEIEAGPNWMEMEEVSLKVAAA